MSLQIFYIKHGQALFEVKTSSGDLATDSANIGLEGGGGNNPPQERQDLVSVMGCVFYSRPVE